MDYLTICTVALLASLLTFYSGFGLGTLLLPAFALFFPVDLAVALVAVVHFLNGVLKLKLTYRHIDHHIAIRFGVPAVAGAMCGAWALTWLARMGPADPVFGHALPASPANMVVGAILIIFAAIEIVPRLNGISFGAKYLAVGGLLSGFLGGLAGMQGALRSAFLVRVAPSKEAFIATGATVASLIDVTRLFVYAELLARYQAHIDFVLLVAAVFAAALGTFIGNSYLKKITMRTIQRVVAAMLFTVGIGLLSGAL